MFQPLRADTLASTRLYLMYRCQALYCRGPDTTPKYYLAIYFHRPASRQAVFVASTDNNNGSHGLAVIFLFQTIIIFTVSQMPAIDAITPLPFALKPGYAALMPPLHWAARAAYAAAPLMDYLIVREFVSSSPRHTTQILRASLQPSAFNESESFVLHRIM